MHEFLKEIIRMAKENVPDLQMPSPDVDIRALRVKWFNDSEGDLHLSDGYECSVCKNKGFIASISSEGAEVMRNCKCQTIRATLQRAKRSGLGDILKEFTFKKYNATEDWQKDIKLKAQEFCVNDDAKWFYIGGQVGSGKSHICTAIASYYIKAGREVKYMLWVDESKFLKGHVNDDVYQEKMRSFKDVEVLYIDDFLKTKQGEEPTAADINLAFELLNFRLLGKDKITIISSEKLINELLDYDEGTMSRVYKAAGKYRFGIGRDRSKNYRLKEEG